METEEGDDGDVLIIDVKIRVKENLLPEFVQTIGYISIDRDGSIWVSDYPQHLNEETGQWGPQERKDERICLLKPSHRLAREGVEFSPVSHGLMPF